MSESSSRDDDAARELERLLAQLLAPSLGHVLRPWPSTLHLALARLARARRTTPIELARALARAPEPSALDVLVSAATVPHTRFFRYPEQFERLGAELPRLAAHRSPVRIWCAGCATGEEPWSVALLADRRGVPVEILATDVSRDALAIAEAGTYARVSTPVGSPISMHEAWSAPDALRKRVRFVRASIVDAERAPRVSAYDVVLCRNVLIYFPPDRASALIAALALHVRSGGVLILSPVEAVDARPPGMAHGSPLGWYDRAPGPVVVAPVEPLPPPVRVVPSRPPADHSGPSIMRADDPLHRAARVLGMGGLDESERLLRELLASSPRRADAWFLLGETLVRRGERSQARAAFERVTEVADSTPEGSTLAEAARRRARMA